MRFETFLNCLDDAGWEGVHDAQHTHIRALWCTMYPVVAELEEEVQEYADAQPPI